MRKDDDIAAFVPRPPPAAPARREAAIEAALRRFDGAPPAAVARPPLWRRRITPPYAGALAGAFLVALIALPLAWTSVPDHVRDAGGGRLSEPAAQVGENPRATADADIAEPVPETSPPLPPGPKATEVRDEPVPAQAPVQAPPPAPAAKAASPPPPAPSEPAPSGAAEMRDSEITVTGSRIRNPNLEASVPVTSIGEDNIVVTGARARRAARRGDWNACTIEDPKPADCRRPGSGPAAAELADGLKRGWAGEGDEAIAAFDRAIEIAPRSAAAYLNRALVHRRRGELDRALADLDRAVRYAPEEARGYYYRSLVLRERGDVRRARVDEARAAELDPSYAPLVRGGRSR